MVFSFSKLLRQLDISFSFRKEHFTQVPFVVMQTFFKIVNYSDKMWKTQDANLEKLVAELNEREADNVISDYNDALL